MNWRWIVRMAWRDSRRNRSRLFLFISSIIIGIASLVALNTFHINLQKDNDGQAAQLLGADLELESNRKPTEEALAFLDTVAAESVDMASEERFLSMMRFNKSQDLQLVQVHGVSGEFPFYGKITTDPSQSAYSYIKEGTVLIDNSLAVKHAVAVQDSIGLGLHQLRIGGTILSRPGQTSFSSAMTPSVYIAKEHLVNSGLQQPGSRVEYHYYFKFPKGIDVDQRLEQWKDRLSELQWRGSTIETTKERTGRAFADVGRFMELVGFVALLLGCIGVSSAVHVYVKEKLLSVAILRCLGASSKQTFFIFLFQFAVIGLIGGVVGAALGSLIQFFIPLFLQDMFPVTISNDLSSSSIVLGIVLGVVIAILFTLLPLMGVRLISPLQSLRISDENANQSDPLRWWVYLLIAIFVVTFTKLQLDDWSTTFAFAGSVFLIFALLYSIAKVFMSSLKRFFPTQWPYLWKQGLSNLYRPNNQTVVLLVAIGFGTALIATLYYVQDMLIHRAEAASSNNRANMLLYDIQPSQREGIIQLALNRKLPILEDIPIVTMQIEKINGKGIRERLRDSTDHVSSRAFRGEIRATYRDSITDTEKIVAGQWVPRVAVGEIGQVSLDQGYADNIGVKLQDTLLMNVQGARISAVVSSLREVDWSRFQSNFRMVFSVGVIDRAPQFYLIGTRVDDGSQALIFQNDVVSRYPNVSVIDMNSIIDVLEEILQKMSFVIQFIGAFSILTGVVVLIASVRISKYQRIKENVLLRTIGASRKQVFTIVIAEYLLLGLLAACTGIIIALLSTNVLAIFVFKGSFVPSLGVSSMIVLSVVVVTVVIGLINSRSTLNVSPMEAIRRN